MTVTANRRSAGTPPDAACAILRGMSIRERVEFWRQFRRELVATGAVQPSSRFLAREMTAPMRRDPRPRHTARRIVEMGPGTGAVTRSIAEAMRPHDRLDAYEINPRFAHYLESAVASAPEYRHARDRIAVHCAPAESAEVDRPVDFVICSIPLNNLPPATVRAVFRAGFAMLGDHGWFTYFEYPGLPRLKARLSSRPERRRVREVREAKAGLSGPDAVRRLVPLNIPPARAVHVPATNGRPGHRR